MKHQYNEHDLEQAIRRTAPGDPPRPDFAQWREKHPEAMCANDLGATADPDRPLVSVIRFGRTIMKKTRVRLGAVAAAILTAVIFFGSGTDKAWSVEQTIAAMKKIETLRITGKNLCGGELVDFECWVAWPGAGEDALRMRYQCGCARKTTVFVQGGTVYAYSPVENVVRVRDGSTIEELQYWYEGAKLSPWLTGKMLQTLRLLGHGWKQTVETDPATGQEHILIRCSHPPSNISFLLVVDPESKLIERAKLWRNLQWEGEPTVDAQVFTYNPEIPKEWFEFQVPPGTRVITQEAEEQDQVVAERERESRALLNQAEHLFHSEEKYVEAIRVYRQVYDRYTETNTAEAALMMIGLCHRRLGEHDEEIKAFEKAVSEYPRLAGWIEATYFYLGRAYLEQGRREKARAAFENCLSAGEGVRAPDEFPLKEARAALAAIRDE